MHCDYECFGCEGREPVCSKGLADAIFFDHGSQALPSRAIA